MAVRFPVLAAVPLVTVPMLWSTEPVPPVNTPVRVVLVPVVMVGAAAVKLVMAGAATTVTVAVCVTLVPAALVTVRV